MSEHSPAPLPARGIYGFTLLLISVLCFLTYCTWAFIPDQTLAAVGLSYWPQKYWAVALPFFGFTCLLLFEIFMCGYNLTVAFSSLSVSSTVEDDFEDK